LALRQALDYFRSQNILPSLVDLREKTETFLNKKSTINQEIPSEIYKFVQWQIERIKDKQKATLQGYYQLLNHLSRFPKGKSLEFRDLTQKRLEDFMGHLKCSISPVTKQPYSTNNVNKIQRRLVAIIGKAKEYGINVNEAYKNRSWKIAPSDDDISGNDIIITPDEIKLLETAELDGRLDRIRDWFLLGLYTGQRFSDFSRLNIDCIFQENGREFVHIIQKKGSVKVRIPSTLKIRYIFEKYKGYPPKITEQKLNQGIKELCKTIGLTQKVVICRDLPDQDIIEIVKEKWECVSTHTARRSFCTNSIKEGKSPSLVMKISGHKNLKTLSRYIKLNLNSPETDDILFEQFG
jgi:integrase